MQREVMSSLKHLTVEQLKTNRTISLKYIRALEKRISEDKSAIAGEEEKLKWIQHYITEKEKHEN